MRDLENRLPNFTFVPALSDPEPEDEWEGETGLITDVVDRYIERADNTEAYLCGSPGMIDACLKVLDDKGVPEERIFYDKFG
jgi:Na+-transporting NADH:ubiquinone oxidoreductase subunit F